MDEIYTFIGKIVAYGGGATVLAYAIFMFLGKKWIESKFDEKFAAFKHAQEQELERYRHQVNILLSRVTKIHEKEIEILPELWHKLQNALGQDLRVRDFGPYKPSGPTRLVNKFLKIFLIFSFKT